MQILLLSLAVTLLATASAQSTGVWKAIQLDAKNWVTCALLEGGALKCWGNNNFGQLGQGDLTRRGNLFMTNRGSSLQPIKLKGLVAQVAVGENHVCARLVNGSVQCWGANDRGQLGLGNTLDHGSSPDTMGDGLPIVDLGTGKTAVQLSAGYTHTCAILNDDTLKCWGENSDGRLGTGDVKDRGSGPGEMGDALLPVRLPPNRRPVNISVGMWHTCTLLDDQTVRCWGYSGYELGLIGIGSNVYSWGGEPNQMGANLPVVDLGGPVVQLAASAQTCVILADGSVKCFGDNRDMGVGVIDHRGGGVGSSKNDMGANLKATLPPGSQAVQVATGWTHTAVVFANGSAITWGLNERGQLGVDDLAARWVRNMTALKLPGTIKYISTGGNMRMAALLADGTIKTWGWGANYGPGNDAASDKDVGGKAGDMASLPVINMGSAADWVQPSPPPLVASPVSRSQPAAAPAPASSTPLPTTIPTAEPATSSDSRVPVGAIVGGVVGGIALLGLAVLGALLLMKRKRAAARSPSPEVDSPPVIPAVPPPAYDILTPTPSRRDYDWILPQQADASGNRPRVQAGINDVELDTAKQWVRDGVWLSPVQMLSPAQVKEQIKLIAGQPLGSGSFGQVFTCVWEQRFPGALLAAKVMRNDDPRMLKSFTYEARLLAAIRHPNIVQVYGYCLQPPMVCIIMELLQGSLDQVLHSVISPQLSKTATGTLVSRSHSSAAASKATNSATQGSSGMGEASAPGAAAGDATAQLAVHANTSPVTASQVTPPSPFAAIPPPPTSPLRSTKSLPTPGTVPLDMTRVLRVALDVASGLEHLHGMHLPVDIKWTADEEDALEEQPSVDIVTGQSGVLHRDLKPANILLNSLGWAKICDFGIARRLQATALQTESEWAGTSQYMAPELLAAKTNKGMRGMVTRKVDIYSLAIIMCELLCHSRSWLRPEQVSCGERPLLPTTDDPDWRADCLTFLNCSPDVLDQMCKLISAMWHHRLDKRPTAQEVRTRLSDLKHLHEQSG